MKPLLLTLLLAAGLQAEICGTKIKTEQFEAQISCIDYDALAPFMPMPVRGKLTQVIVSVTDQSAVKMCITVSGMSVESSVVNKIAYAGFEGFGHSTIDIAAKRCEVKP